jgi:hypothetical protein
MGGEGADIVVAEGGGGEEKTLVVQCEKERVDGEKTLRRCCRSDS